MLNFMSKIMLFHNFKYVENNAFDRKKMPGSQKDISLFPAMMYGVMIVKCMYILQCVCLINEIVKA